MSQDAAILSREQEVAVKTFKILAADKLAPEGLAWIESQPDTELTNKPGLSEQELAGIVGEHDAMIVRSGVQVTARMLENPGRLKVIARAGVGVDNIDLDAATNKGILVMNSAEASTISTAEHAFALMMALCRNIGPAYKKMAEGGWDRSQFVGSQLAGKTLGVVGFGRIGQTMAKRALAFDMNVRAYDPYINADTMLDGRVKMYREFVDLIPHVDILTFHVPLNEITRGMLDAERFKLCRKGVLVINAARGGVVDEQALLEALESGQCGGAGLDVYPQEPLASDSPLRNHPKLLTTPHLGASTREAQQAVSIVAAGNALAYLRGEGVQGAVNAPGLRVDLDPLQQWFVDLAQRMASLIAPMVTRGIASLTLELIGQRIAPAAGTIERVALVGLLSEHLTIPVNVINAKQVAEGRGIKLRTVTVEDEGTTGPQLKIEITGPSDAVDSTTPPSDISRRIIGRVYDDMRPRVIEINGYHMDMIPAGHMVLIQNEDLPGRIGLVGTEFGKAEVNIADMAISRRGETGAATALMVLKIDEQPPESLLKSLKEQPGILKIAAVKLSDEPS